MRVNDGVQQKGERVAILLAGALKGLSLYPPAHPSFLKPLHELTDILELLLAQRPEVRIGIMDHTLFFEQILFVNATSIQEEIASFLAARGIEAIVFLPGLTKEELAKFVAILANQDVDVTRTAHEAQQAGITHIRMLFFERKKTEIRPKQPTTAAATYNKALHTIRKAFSDLGGGRIPNSHDIIDVVSSMADQTIQDPSAMVGLTMIKDYDSYTFNHSVNVGILSMALGVALRVDSTKLRHLGMAGLLHDIGKVTIRKSVLNKPGKLSPSEFEEIKKHPENGARIISRMKEIPQAVILAVLGHHIMHNRQGYPEWAREKSFDAMAGVVAIADCYDAITTLRVYQRPVSPKEALERLKALSGTYLDDKLVKAFVQMMGKYPVGTLVRLQTNEVAIVVRCDPSKGSTPSVKIVIGADGKRLDSPRETKLERLSHIVSSVDPIAKDINAGDYLM